MQIAVLSGKGGTGKTTIAVALAELIKNCVKIDCDVDAANMYLYYKGNTIEKNSFFSGKTAKIDLNKCIKCDKCIINCRFDAIHNYKVDSLKCEGCGVCNIVCPTNAISLCDNHIADVIKEEVDHSNLIRADMEIGADGSGKLITQLREQIDNANDLVIIDGSPGIGCPVIASITNIDYALVVSEPTLSGLEDLKRIIKLIESFKVKPYVCINKYDINMDITNVLKKYCNDKNIEIIGLIPYDDLVIKSINELKPIIYYQKSKARAEIQKIANKFLEIYKRSVGGNYD